MAVDVKNVVVGRFWDGTSENTKSGYIDLGILGRIQLQLIRSDRNNSKDSSSWIVTIRADRTLLGALTFIQKNIDSVLFEDEDDPNQNQQGE